MVQWNMFTLFNRVEEDILRLIGEATWQSKYIDYSPPYVERLYTDIPLIRDGESEPTTHRLYLHRIHPCLRAFFHPHPWPSAVRVLGNLSGEDSFYEMGIGFGPNERHDPPPLAARMIVQNGFHYEMEHPDGWHYVKVIGAPSVSVMLTGPVWERPGGAPRTENRKFRELTDQEREGLFQDVRSFYTGPNAGLKRRDEVFRLNRPAKLWGGRDGIDAVVKAGTLVRIKTTGAAGVFVEMVDAPFGSLGWWEQMFCLDPVG